MTFNVSLTNYVQKGPLKRIHAAALIATEPLSVGCWLRHAFYFCRSRKSDGIFYAEKANMDAVIPVLEGRVHPLHGIYSRLVGSEAEVLLEQKQYRLMGLLDHIDWKSVENDFFEQQSIPTNFATNVNTPEEYKQMLDNLP